jgi:short-subunit dehydrogenase involved in D-alanine esterification of teichoic acids
MRPFVTGGGSGIGEALAITFARHGASVAICGRNSEKLEQVRKKHSGLRAYKTDVTIHDH